MSNLALVEKIQALRDRYTQQHKNNTALQSAFKAFQVSHSKTLKALTDYVGESPEHQHAQEAFSQSNLKENTIDPLLPLLRREDKSLAILLSALKQTLIALSTDPVDVVRFAKAVEQLQNAPTDVQAILPELKSELDIAQLQLGTEFGEKLRDALATQGVTIGGRAPRFELGHFELEANFAKRSLRLNYGRDEVIPQLSITVDATLKAYQSALKTITGRNEEGARWMAMLMEASQNVRRKRQLDTTRVNLVECYVEMTILRQGRQFAIAPSKRTFNDYTRAQFVYDFYEFAHRQRLNHEGKVIRAHSATKSQTENPAKSFWVVEGDSPYDGRYIADIEWETA